MPPRYNYQPEDMEYPLAYRLAQFLLGASGAVGQYGQGMRQQSSDASDILDTQERQRLAQEEMSRRNRSTDLEEYAFALKHLAPQPPKAPTFFERDPKKDLYLGTELKERGTPEPTKPRAPIVGSHPADQDVTEYDPETREFRVLRGAQPKPPRSFAEGKTTTELELIVNDPTTPPEQKAIAQAALASIEKRDLTKAQQTGAIASALRTQEGADRAMGPQPRTADERKGLAEGERSVQLAQRALQTLTANPTWAGGPLGLQGRAREWQSSLGTAPEGFARFESDIAEIYGTYARRIAGAALTPTEKSTYLKYLPNLTTDSDQQFRAKLEAFPERVRVIDDALERARLGTGASAPAAPVAPSGAGGGAGPAAGGLSPAGQAYKQKWGY